MTTTKKDFDRSRRNGRATLGIGPSGIHGSFVLIVFCKISNEHIHTRMVDIEEIMTDASSSPGSAEERLLLDAEEIETVAKTLQRPTARMQLESLAKKLRREAAALKIVERQMGSGAADATGAAAAGDDAAPTAKPVPVSPPPSPPQPVPLGPITTGSTTSVTYTPIDRFSFDAGGYNEQFVTLYVPLPGVGTIPKDQVQCNFEKAAFDLIVKDLKGKSYRLKKDLLEHDIVVNKSKIVIKADKIIIKLAKIKGEYGSYDYWSKLTDPKRNDKKKSSNPAASITELMKDMYESGDDNMRKMIGETMMKQHRGELGKGTDMGLGDMDLGDDL